jgi:hypothetical protein
MEDDWQLTIVNANGTRRTIWFHVRMHYSVAVGAPKSVRSTRVDASIYISHRTENLQRVRNVHHKCTHDRK